MKLKYKILNHKPNNSFLVRRETMPCLEDNWHFHEECELIYFLKSNGTMYVGNTIGNFEEGEVYLIGKNLPHLFRNRKTHVGSENETEYNTELIIIQFKSDFLGKEFSALPEAKTLQKLIEASSKGIRFSKMTAKEIHHLFVSTAENNGFSSLVSFLKILDILSSSDDFEFICASDMPNSFRKIDRERMSKVVNYLSENYARKIDLPEIAKIANMAPNAFCRFFRKNTQKPFSKYLAEIRIEQACRYLIEGNLQIAEISYLTGFNSPSNFNRRFKDVLGKTPSEYLQGFSVNK